MRGFTLGWWFLPYADFRASSVFLVDGRDNLVGVLICEVRKLGQLERCSTASFTISMNGVYRYSHLWSAGR